MGAFFANLQVFIGELSPIEAEQRVLSELSQWLQEHNYKQAADTKSASRTFIIGATQPSGRWLTIYDEGMDDLDVRRMDEIAAVLSLRVNFPIAGILVCDSDDLFVRLYEQGKLADEVHCSVGGGGKGLASKWAPYLLPHITEFELKRLWKTANTFAEETLEEMAEAVGWPMPFCALGYRYAVEEGVPNYFRIVGYSKS
ncbi:hypothetical protein [Paenibacillus sp. MMS18-CY102]|uniref:hypothetical protein n=1 Tax=Paenibacillus sp. MMS18-CY102 TaxID=2682849 RepID=UPI00136649E7|nr:hypothetical protein [Paenibacillus sp. MMS18-CY102]MWC28066.1 hypothetical protein [Paenibacillus sp. MMS18-CY102]